MTHFDPPLTAIEQELEWALKRITLLEATLANHREMDEQRTQSLLARIQQGNQVIQDRELEIQSLRQEVERLLRETEEKS